MYLELHLLWISDDLVSYARRCVFPQFFDFFDFLKIFRFFRFFENFSIFLIFWAPKIFWTKIFDFPKNVYKGLLGPENSISGMKLTFKQVLESNRHFWKSRFLTIFEPIFASEPDFWPKIWPHSATEMSYRCVRCLKRRGRATLLLGQTR